MSAAARTTILVTGIGGHVGQGILRNLRSFEQPLRLVGTDIASSTAGHHYCDAFHRVPYAYDPTYPKTIEAICATESVDLIIPSTDYESYHLALIRDRLPTLLGSPVTFARTCLDKYATHAAFYECGIPFVDTTLPSLYAGEWDRIIVKPREGRGSRDVHVDPSDWRQFDDTFIVQQRLIGPELTTAFYVDRNGTLVGEITFERTLFAGYTLTAHVTQAYRREISSLIQMMLEAFTIRGPCNIQAIATSGGPIPFELNSRYSAISSFSSQFGFDDVRYAVDEYLFGLTPTTPRVGTGFVHRLFVDLVYKEQSYNDIEPGASRSYIFADPASSVVELSRRMADPSSDVVRRPLDTSHVHSREILADDP